jgi:hypothetical protein
LYIDFQHMVETSYDTSLMTLLFVLAILMCVVSESTFFLLKLFSKQYRRSRMVLPVIMHGNICSSLFIRAMGRYDLVWFQK